MADNKKLMGLWRDQQQLVVSREARRKLSVEAAKVAADASSAAVSLAEEVEAGVKEEQEEVRNLVGLRKGGGKRRRGVGWAEGCARMEGTGSGGGDGEGNKSPMSRAGKCLDWGRELEGARGLEVAMSIFYWLQPKTACRWLAMCTL